MKIENIQVLAGLNFWSTRTCIQMRLNIGELEQKPTDKINVFS